MKNFLKFVLFVAILSFAISSLYDYQLRHGGLNLLGQRTPEKYTLATAPSVDPKDVTSLEALNRERRALVNSVIPSVVAIKTSKTITRREQSLDPFQFFFRNSADLSQSARRGSRAKLSWLRRHRDERGTYHYQ